MSDHPSDELAVWSYAQKNGTPLWAFSCCCGGDGDHESGFATAAAALTAALEHVTGGET